MERKRFAIYFLLVGLIMLFLSACSGEQTKPENTQNVETEANKGDSKSENAIDEGLAREGEKIVKSNCIGCHGVDLNGDLGPNLHNLPHTKEQIIEVLIKGGRSMPPRTAPGNEEAVAEYLLTLKES